MFSLPYTDHEDRELVSTKCLICKEPTVHEYLKIIPVHYETDTSHDDPLALLKLSKRLMICTQCGTLSLKN